MTDAPDFSGEQAPAASQDQLQMLLEMARTLRDKINAVEDAQAVLTRLSNDLTHFQQTVLPEAMELAGLGEYVMQGPQAEAYGMAGVKLVVKDDIKASISEENKPEAHEWLRAHGHGGVVKASIIVDVRAMDEEDLTKLRGELRKFDVDTEDKEAVHPSTLKSLVNELLEAGTTLPPAISVFQYKKAELKEPKSMKATKAARANTAKRARGE